MALHPEFAGQLLMKLGDQTHATFLVDDDGSRRWIPNYETYKNLFGEWEEGKNVQEVVDIEAIDRGTDISDGAILVRDESLDPTPVYLIDNGKKRWVKSMAVMDKFHFVLQNSIPIPHIVLDYIQSGPQIS